MVAEEIRLIALIFSVLAAPVATARKARPIRFQVSSTQPAPMSGRGMGRGPQRLPTEVPRLLREGDGPIQDF